MYKLNAVLVVVLCGGLAAWESVARGQASETLYNGIELPAEWPPRPESFAHGQPVTPPYLLTPPEVIGIDVGRQLLVDDFLIESTDLQRTYHQPMPYEGNPVMRPSTPHDNWRERPFAAPFSDGVWWDPQAKLFKMWYLAGTGFGFGYATSSDGLQWTKPRLDDGLHGNTNVLDVRPADRDSSTVWLNLDEPDPSRRYTMTYYRSGLQTRFSADGINWSDVAVTHRAGDRTTIFYNPFRKVWVYSVRGSARGLGRCRYYAETRDMAAKSWDQVSELSRWACADALDRKPDRQYAGDLPDLYNLDATPYESLILGLFTIHAEVAHPASGRPKLNSVTLGYSRDGFHWHRPDRRPFLNTSDDPRAWNWGNVQSAGGGCLVVGDRLYFYYSGRNSRQAPDDGSGGATGLAFLRRDGFASLDAAGEAGQLTTRPLRFAGKHLFVNADLAGGELRAEVLDPQGNVIEPFTAENCLPLSSDLAAMAVRWQGADDLSLLAGKPVKFRFRMRGGSLFAFWVSPDATGASHGYVAAGGPGFTGHRDTVGEAVRE